MRPVLALIAVCPMLHACGDDGNPSQARDTTAADSADADTQTTDTQTTDTQTTDTQTTDTQTTDTVPDSAADTGDVGPAAVPMIGEVLTCGTRAEVGGIERGEELRRVLVDTGVFPDALCNDGSGAVFYVRPYEGEANRNNWVIQLKGGGGCGGQADCAKRWCSVLTLFGKTQMVQDINDPPLATIAGDGVLSRDPEHDNPFAGFNQVYVQYCSSDGWSGTARDRIIETLHPCDPAAGDRCPDGSACPGEDAGRLAGLCADQPVRFRMHFLGSRIVDAVIATLRQDGVAPLALPDGASAPDLDDAAYVVLAGASAGGAGVTHNLDRVAATLRAHNTACQGGGGGDCPLVVDGIIDSIYAPTVEGLDISGIAGCAEAGACDYESAYRLITSAGEPVLQGRNGDASCQDYHAADDTAWRCSDMNHVIRHHITTPFYLRMGLTDVLLMDGFLSAGYKTPAGEPIDQPIEFATLLHDQMEWFVEWADLAEEADGDAIAPAVFGPGCPKHETLSDDVPVYDVTIDFQGTDVHMFDLWRYWKDGNTPAVLVADTPADSVCE